MRAMKPMFASAAPLASQPAGRHRIAGSCLVASLLNAAADRPAARRLAATCSCLLSASNLLPTRISAASVLLSVPSRLPERWPAPVQTSGSPWVRALPPLWL